MYVIIFIQLLTILQFSAGAIIEAAEKNFREFIKDGKNLVDLGGAKMLEHLDKLKTS